MICYLSDLRTSDFNLSSHILLESVVITAMWIFCPPVRAVPVLSSPIVSHLGLSWPILAHPVVSGLIMHLHSVLFVIRWSGMEGVEERNVLPQTCAKRAFLGLKWRSVAVWCGVVHIVQPLVMMKKHGLDADPNSH